MEAVDRSLSTRETALKLVKFHLHRAQNRMKQQADKHRSDRNYEIGTWVYVKLQPYRQTIVVNRKCLKLSARFFGPYQIVSKIGSVAYKLALPAGSKIHLVFHVSQLKLHRGPFSQPFPLPLLDDTGILVKESISILDRHIGRKGDKAITKILVHWRNTFPEDATWRYSPNFSNSFQIFIFEDKDVLKG